MKKLGLIAATAVLSLGLATPVALAETTKNGTIAIDGPTGAYTLTAVPSVKFTGGQLSLSGSNVLISGYLPTFTASDLTIENLDVNAGKQFEVTATTSGLPTGAQVNLGFANGSNVGLGQSNTGSVKMDVNFGTRTTIKLNTASLTANGVNPSALAGGVTATVTYTAAPQQ